MVGWGVTSSSGEEDNGKNVENDDEPLVGEVHSGGQRSSSLGPSFYHQSDDGEFSHWLREYHELVFDVMSTSHYECLSDQMDRSRSEE